MTTTATSSAEISADIVIFGGGVAGLWMLNQLTSAGFSVLLLETTALGNGQSIASQGIIHGGLKYALGGSLSEAAKSIAGMPTRWRSSLAGNDRVDLSGCRTLSDRYYMWSEGSYRSRLKAFLGSKSLRGKIEAVAESDYPHSMQQAKGQGSLYSLPDFVIDTGSLIDTLAGHYSDLIFSLDSTTYTFSPATERGATQINIDTGDGRLTIRAQRIVLAAGEGNAALLQLAGLAGPTMQTRPLNMVLLRKRGLPKLFVHCIGDNFSLTPVLTLTSHPCADGDTAWYLGGELAETGVKRNDSEQIAVATRTVQDLFPWVDLRDASWACLRINRAEGSEEGQHRPDSAFLKAEQNFLVAWPTKFTLSPALADQVVLELSDQGVKPTWRYRPEIPASFMKSVSVAQPPWETCFAEA